MIAYFGVRGIMQKIIKIFMKPIKRYFYNPILIGSIFFAVLIIAFNPDLKEKNYKDLEGIERRVGNVKVSMLDTKELYDLNSHELMYVII
jgi:hypothetical protein